jgi:hypothetical protein
MPEDMAFDTPLLRRRPIRHYHNDDHEKENDGDDCLDFCLPASAEQQ